jgi:hypothetical protein
MMQKISIKEFQMSDNCNSTVDNIAGGIILGLFLIAVIIFFPIIPGAVLGWELAKQLKFNQDIMIMFSLLGAFVNFGFYQIILWLSNGSYQKKEKVFAYLFTITTLLVMNNLFENSFLKKFDELFFKALFFFTDFTRWFTDTPILNGFLFVLYAFVMLKLYIYFTELFKHSYTKYRNKSFTNGAKQ